MHITGSESKLYQSALSSTHKLFVPFIYFHFILTSTNDFAESESFSFPQEQDWMAGKSRE